MEVKSNLLSSDRTEALKRFSTPQFKKVAHVVLGEPTSDYKARVQEALLKEKQEKANQQFQKEKAEKAKKKAAEKKKEAAETKAAEAPAKKEEEEKKEDVDMKDEEKKEEKKAEEEKPAEPEEKEEEEEDAEPPKVELDEQEKELNFLPVKRHDLAPSDMTNSFAKFCVPEKDEGFDDIRYEWLKGEKAKDYLQAIVKKYKLSTKIEDLKPGTAFQEKYSEWKKKYQGWQDKQKSWKASQKKEKKEDEDDDDEIDVSKPEDIADVGQG